MIYETAKIDFIENSESIWQKLKSILIGGDLNSLYPQLRNVEIISENNGVITRNVTTGNVLSKETVTISEINKKISIVTDDNLDYNIENTFQLIFPNDEFLAEKSCSLLILVSYRIRPGRSAVPKINGSEVIENLKNKLEIYLK